MVEKETTIGAAKGLHARPAAAFVQKAKGFSSEIVVAPCSSPRSRSG
jgi:phosphotransferase system HPr (HPr) family protein